MEDYKRVNAEWYYIVGEDSFAFVKKDFWHKNGHMDSIELTNLLTFPEGFYELSEADFEYDGPMDEGERLLRDYGFEKLENPWK